MLGKQLTYSIILRLTISFQ